MSDIDYSYNTAFRLDFDITNLDTGYLKTVEGTGYNSSYTDLNILLGKSGAAGKLGYYSNEAAGSGGTFANEHAVTLTPSKATKLTDMTVSFHGAGTFNGSQIAPPTAATIEITTNGSVETLTPEIVNGTITITGLSYTKVTQITITVTAGTARAYFGITSLYTNISTDQFSFSNNIISAKIVDQIGFYGDAEPMSQLTVVIDDPDDTYSITKNNGKYELFEINQEAHAYEDVIRYIYGDNYSGYSWHRDPLQTDTTIDLGTWYFQKAESRDGKLTMIFTDANGLQDKQPGVQAQYIDCKRTRAQYYRDVKNYNGTTIGPLTSDQTLREQAQQYSIFRNVSIDRADKRIFDGIDTAGMVRSAKLKMAQQVTKVKGSYPFRWVSLPTASNWDLINSVNAESPTSYFKNYSDYMRDLGTFKIDPNRISFLKISGYYYFCYRLDVSGCHYPRAYYGVSYLNGQSVDLVYVAPSITVNPLSDTGGVWLWFVLPNYYISTTEPTDEEKKQMIACIDSFRLWGIDAREYVNAYYAAGTYTVKPGGQWIYTTQNNVLVAAGDATITAVNIDSITFTVNTAGLVKIVGVALQEEKRTQLAEIEGNDENTIEQHVCSYNADMILPNGWAAARLENLQKWSIDAELEIVPWYQLTGSNWDNMSTEGHWIEPGKIFCYTPHDDADEYCSFRIYITEVETDLTGGFVRTVKGKAYKV